jgi:hypothetical protein
MEQRVVHPGGGGDGFRARPGQAVPGEGALGGGQDGLARRLAGAVPAGRSPVGGAFRHHLINWIVKPLRSIRQAPNAPRRRGGRIPLFWVIPVGAEAL